MGLFDYFVPQTELRCPACGVALNEWQGKDGPGALFVWEEGKPAPTGQEAGSWSLPKRERARFRLPDCFEIYSGDCGRHLVTAVCRCEDGVWTMTGVVGAKPRPGMLVS